MHLDTTVLKFGSIRFLKEILEFMGLYFILISIAGGIVTILDLYWIGTILGQVGSLWLLWKKSPTAIKNLFVKIMPVIFPFMVTFFGEICRESRTQKRRDVDVPTSTYYEPTEFGAPFNPDNDYATQYSVKSRYE